VTSAPDDLSTAVSLGLDANGEPTLSIAVCWCGPIEEGERVSAPLRAAGPPLADSVG
jgi:hypothetical protein